MRKTYKERGQALSNVLAAASPTYLYPSSSENLSHAQFPANFQGDQICDNQQTAEISGKIFITEKLTFFLLARDYLVQKSWLQNIIQIIVLAIRMIGGPACGQIKTKCNVDTW